MFVGAAGRTASYHPVPAIVAPEGSHHDHPTPGDVYSFPIERIGRFGACQVVDVDETGHSAVVTVLDWTGAREPELTDLAGVGRLVKDLMFWTPREILTRVRLPVPTRYRRLGVLPITGETESRHDGDWDFDEEVVRQHWWNSLPAELTTAFKAALTTGNDDGRGSVTVAGLLDPVSGEPYRFRAREADEFADDARYQIADDFRLENLRPWPLLHQISLHSWRNDLIPFLETSPLVGYLVLAGHGQHTLDFSGTQLNRLTVELAGLRRLVLPPSLDMLILLGTPDGPLQVEAEGQGRWITVYLRESVPVINGLESPQGVRVDGIRQVDVADLATRFPGAGYLMLFGAPGLLSGLPALTRFPRLESIRLCDLFGYGPDDLPGPGELPALTSLDLSSIPADVATSARKAYGKHPRVELSVSRPRRPTWLAENLENPLRHWDGREGIPAAAAKRARTAYVTALREVREADALRDNPAGYDQAVTAAATAFLDVIGVLGRRYGFLYTLERDEVVDAIAALTTHLSSAAQRALEPVLEEALD